MAHIIYAEYQPQLSTLGITRPSAFTIGNAARDRKVRPKISILSILSLTLRPSSSSRYSPAPPRTGPRYTPFAPSPPLPPLPTLSEPSNRQISRPPARLTTSYSTPSRPQNHIESLPKAKPASPSDKIPKSSAMRSLGWQPTSMPKEQAPGSHHQKTGRQAQTTGCHPRMYIIS